MVIISEIPHLIEPHRAALTSSVPGESNLTLKVPLARRTEFVTCKGQSRESQTHVDVLAVVCGRAIAQAVSRWVPTAAALVQTRA
jgi:hypothetical protein